MKRLLVCFVLILSFVCVPIGSQTSYGATKTKAQSKYVSNKVADCKIKLNMQIE